MQGNKRNTEEEPHPQSSSNTALAPLKPPRDGPGKEDNNSSYPPVTVHILPPENARIRSQATIDTRGQHGGHLADTNDLRSRKLRGWLERGQRNGHAPRHRKADADGEDRAIPDDERHLKGR